MVTLVNRAYVSTSTTGTGTITLGSAETGYQTFANAGVADGDVVRYTIVDGANWEIGTGTYTSSGTTLSRTPSESSNSGSAINLSGAAKVFLTATEADFREERVGSVSVGTLDLSTGTLFEKTLTADTTFVFSNPPVSGTGYTFNLNVTGAELTIAYDTDMMVYDGVSFDETNDSSLNAVEFNSDGTKVYTLGTGSNTVRQYPLSTAYDLSTAGALEASFAIGLSSCYGIRFNPAGTKMYVIAGANSLRQYTLSTAFDVSTATYDSVAYDFTSEVSSTIAFDFSNSGNTLYAFAYTDDTVRQYTLSTAYDVSTMSYASKSVSTGGVVNFPGGIFVTPDGTKMFVTGSSYDRIREYAFGTDYDVSTATYTNRSLLLSSQDSAPKGITFNSDGTKMYMAGATSDFVYQYTSGEIRPAAITFPASVEWLESYASGSYSPADGSVVSYTFTTTDGGTTYYGKAGVNTVEATTNSALTWDGTGLTWVETPISGLFYYNSQTISSDYTIESNKNAMSAGTITIASGVTVTVPSGSTWTVV